MYYISEKHLIVLRKNSCKQIHIVYNNRYLIVIYECCVFHAFLRKTGVCVGSDRVSRNLIKLIISEEKNDSFRKNKGQRAIL